MNLILAVDLSTTVCGYAIFNKSTKELINFNYYKFESEELIDRAAELESLLVSIKTTAEQGELIISDFIIEERLKSFRSGGTNASAMLNTAQMNFLCQYLSKNIYGFNLVEINVNNARSLCFPGFHKIARMRKDVKQKEVAFEMVKKELGESLFPKKILKSGPRKGEEIFIEEGKDMSDAYILGRAFLNKKEEKIEVNGKTSKTKAGSGKRSTGSTKRNTKKCDISDGILS